MNGTNARRCGPEGMSPVLLTQAEVAAVDVDGVEVEGTVRHVFKACSQRRHRLA